VTTEELGLEEKVELLADALLAAGLPHAFGGAIAFAYYGEPRVTIDVDINVFVRPEQAAAVFAALAPLGVTAHETAVSEVERDGQVGLRWGRTPVDLFFAYDAFHDHAAKRVRAVPFGKVTIPILAAEDLLVRKAVFDRRKDWIDIDQILALTAGDLDIDDVRRWVTRIVGSDDARLAKLNAAIAEILDP
jgi:inosine-uridine nucleoside N-ribohydrolase